MYSLESTVGFLLLSFDFFFLVLLAALNDLPRLLFFDLKETLLFLLDIDIFSLLFFP